MVVLNLQTGQYHGLNRSAGRMLEVLAEVGDVGVAADLLSEEFAQPVGKISRDLAELCDALAERSLVEMDPSPPPPVEGPPKADSQPDG
jgi:hypothetical protein